MFDNLKIATMVQKALRHNTFQLSGEKKDVVQRKMNKLLPMVILNEIPFCIIYVEVAQL